MYIFLKKIIKGLLNFYPLSIKKKDLKNHPYIIYKNIYLV